MRAKEFIVEYRDRMYQYIKSVVPTWPDYIVKDWLYANFARGATQTPNWSFETVGKDIPIILKDMGLSVNTKWQLVPNMKFTMDMWEPKTLKRLEARAGGSSKSTDPDVHIPARDAERHATQAALAQQQGGVRKEPVILIKTSRGYELLEGWHRTIQHFAKYPDGYVGPAYIAVAQGQQSVSEEITPQILYHATYRPLLKSIKQHGLGGDKAQAKWEDSKPGVVYLATSPDVAESYAESSDVVPEEWLDNIVVLKIDTSKLDQSKLMTDRNVLDNSGDTLEYHGVIPVNLIS